MADFSDIPDEWTAWELRSHQARTMFSCELSKLDGDAGHEIYAYGRRKPTVDEAIQSAIDEAKTLSR